jgi:hypothetical protein
LLGALSEHFRGEHLHRRILVGPRESALRAWFFNHTQVLSDRATQDGGWQMELMMPRIELERLLRRDGSLASRLISEKPDIAVSG